jgi:hypothetical protein
MVDDEIKNILLNGGNRYNYLIVPMDVYNILLFMKEFKIEDFGELSFPVKVGSLFMYEVFLDIHLPGGQIMLSYDKSIMRDNKIDQILEGVRPKKEIIVKLKSDISDYYDKKKSVKN